MYVLTRIPAFLSLFLLGALSMRLGLALPLALLFTLISEVALFLPFPMIQRLLITLLWVGAVAWLGMAWLRVSERLSLGEPWLRLAIILIAVALVTGWSAWLLKRQTS